MRTSSRLGLCLALAAFLPAQVDGPTRERELAAAREIDRLVTAHLAQKGRKPNPVVDDTTFVRRAYLAIAGRIPTAGEVAAFEKLPAASRRQALVESLVGSPAHQSHLFNWWADLLRIRTRLNRQVSGEPYMHWLQDALAQNKPYDVMVKELLAAEGPAHAPGNGATGYHLRDLGMPEDDMANTMRLFLGTRLECAQCHDHPFDKWKQKEFFELVAFNGGMQYRTGFEQSPQAQALRESTRALLEQHGQRAQQALRQVVLTATLGITGSGTGYARLPDTYRYPDARPNQPVQADVPFGNAVALDLPPPRPGARQPRRPARRGNAGLGTPAGTRKAFADWLASPDNPRFATVIVNRFFKRTFGRALIEPLDDLRDDTRASIPELMAHLERLVVDLRFDLRAFERILLRTELFQRAVAGDPDGDFAFEGPLLRRMTAEQLWDSLLTVVVPDVDATLRPPGARAAEVYARYQQIVNATPETIVREVEDYLLRQSDPQKYRAMMRERARLEMEEKEAQAEANLRKARPLFRALAAARRNGDAEAEARAAAALRELGVPLPGERVRRARPDQTLARASELPQPAPPGHLLREFGQSPRDVIDGGHTEASVPQVLDLLNGFVDQRLLNNPNAALR
ncbi:MAG TPA: DUF1549 domain-containing protein, partial [Planctomycetota bacterium]|nr:DUF1549 domain-containing protein [Planctomycetota bacterium]